MTNPPVAPHTVLLRDVENLLSILQRCVPNFENIDRLSFDPHTNNETAWDVWCKKVAQPIFIPTMKKVYEQAIAGHVREIVELDKALALEAMPAMPKLCHEGRRLLLSHLPPKCERTLQRYFLHAQAEETPACFPVVHALRGAVFHAPFAMVAESYIFLEATLVTAAGRSGIRPGTLLEKFLRSSTCVENLHAA
jgi:hypothetical protein